MSIRMIRGQAAIDAAESGAVLWVLSSQRGWQPAGKKALNRARRMEPWALWIYGVRAVEV